MENILKGAAFSLKRKKNMLIVSITNEKDQSDFFLCRLSELATGLVFVRGAAFFRHRPLARPSHHNPN